MHGHGTSKEIWQHALGIFVSSDETVLYCVLRFWRDKQKKIDRTRSTGERNVWLDNMMNQARRFVYTIFKSRFLEKWIQSFSGLHLLFWESGECVPPVCDDESGKTIVYTIFKPKFLETKYILSQGFISYPENRVHRDYDVVERHGRCSFRLALPFRCLHGADWTVVQTDVYYFLVPANCLKSDSV